MSKVTNTLNKGAAIKKLGDSQEEMERHFKTQLEEYKGRYGNEFPELMEILEDLMGSMLHAMYY